MTHWYFGSGNGLLLPDPTKRLYLEVKARLGRYAEGSDKADVEAGHSPADEGTRRISEIGMLRAQTRADLDIYGLPYLTGVPDPDEAELLRSAGIDPAGWLLEPWTSRVATAVGKTFRTPHRGTTAWSRSAKPPCRLLNKKTGSVPPSRRRAQDVIARSLAEEVLVELAAVVHSPAFPAMTGHTPVTSRAGSPGRLGTRAAAHE